MERLDLRLVEYFVVVAEELHFSRAAARLHIAQPSLSQQIARLEALVGVRLLERTSRRVELTRAGETLLVEGREILEHGGRVLQAVRTAEREQLAVGFYGSAATVRLPRVLVEFAARNPDVEVSVRELLLGDLDELTSGRVDVAFTRLMPGQADLEIEVIAHERRLLAVHARHRLATRRSVELSELSEESFITNPAVPSAGPPVRWLSEQQAHGLPGKIVAEATSVEEILALVAAGRGICVVPVPVAVHYPREDVSYVAVKDAEPAVVSLAWRRGPRSGSLAAFVEIAREGESRST